MRENNVLIRLYLVIAMAAAALVGVAAVFDWKTAVSVEVVCALVWCGYQLAVEKLHADRVRIKRERAALEAEWRTLDRTRQIRETFWRARLSLREEAQHQWLADHSDKEGQR